LLIVTLKVTFVNNNEYVGSPYETTGRFNGLFWQSLTVAVSIPLDPQALPSDFSQQDFFLRTVLVFTSEIKHEKKRGIGFEVSVCSFLKIICRIEIR